jgi:hypothetical protein
MRDEFRRLTAVILAWVLLVTAGCAGGPTRLDREDLLDPPAAKTYRVTTRDGRTLAFIALHMEEDSLVGTVRRTASETVGEGETQRTNVTNRYEEARLPWADVALVEAVGTKGGPSGILLVGGAIALGAAVFLLLNGGSDPPPDGGGGGKGM